MSSISDYQDLLPEIQAIEPQEVLTPNVPVKVFVQEAEDLWHWCIDDQEALTRAGLNWEFVTSLPTRAGACREAQSLWTKERKLIQQAEQDWKNEAPIAFELRNSLLHNFRFAFRKNAELMASLDEIAQGDSNADMVQDLNDLSVLGKANPDLLTAINFDLTQLDTAATTSDRMGDLLGATNGERKENSPTMDIRDRAFTYLKEAVDEIRDHGKFVFFRNPARLKGYISDYWKDQKGNDEKKA